MSWYYLEKEFYDYADDIEGVNIHYVCTPIGGVADWENQRATRFMPLLQSSSSLSLDPSTPAARATNSSLARLRQKILKLPQRILDSQSGTLTDRYLLHHYFEVFQDGRRYYSPLYTEEIVIGANTQSAAPDAISEDRSTPPLTVAYADVKESEG
jgi:hypothetical protein